MDIYIISKRIYTFIYTYIYIWLGNFRYNCKRGQLNNEGRGELQEIKQSRDKTKIGKEIML